MKLYLSAEEKSFIKSKKYKTFYLRNGINFQDTKHMHYTFKVYFITGLTSLYLEHIENEWRRNGLPILCSYKT